MYILNIILKNIIIALLIFFKTFISLSFAINNTPLNKESNIFTLSTILKKVMPSIVNIITIQKHTNNIYILKEKKTNNFQKKNFFYNKQKIQNIGSGIIIDSENGLIITNNHVISNANSIIVTLNNGKRLNAKLIGSDSETDIAVLKINIKNLPKIPIGNSDKAEVGDFVVAIGNPFGLNNSGSNQTVTFGIISATKRNNLNIEKLENFIQTDAAINPGNSGGALLNMRGELIGINTAIISPHVGNVGIGFAIPINMAKKIAKQLIKYGFIHRGLLGIITQNITPELAKAMGYPKNLHGVIITKVEQESSAKKSGLKPRDIILQINKTIINKIEQIKFIMGLSRVGELIHLKILRNGKKICLNSVIMDSKKYINKVQLKNPFLYGLALKNYEEYSLSYEHIIGVQIINLLKNSIGWKSGLQSNDIITSANNKIILNMNMLDSISKKAKSKLILQILRGKKVLYIVLTLK
ncbi:protease [Candidatus Legionella polyplacis]|uniref:trypsin-like peptidase domain-containing protein n=1 Tax=Candidatus Legionella polyplacis TaxID=2005262 RepID=UPI000C1F0A13|nr:trypsin-like peptidase domain-containing protein [Candidatus Legionella polyplacis]ATW01658.1 protease [Candidatus Legionella polyplacis]